MSTACAATCAADPAPIRRQARRGHRYRARTTPHLVAACRIGAEGHQFFDRGEVGGGPIGRPRWYCRRVPYGTAIFSGHNGRTVTRGAPHSAPSRAPLGRRGMGGRGVHRCSGRHLPFGVFGVVAICWSSPRSPSSSSRCWHRPARLPPIRRRRHRRPQVRRQTQARARRRTRAPRRRAHQPLPTPRRPHPATRPRRRRRQHRVIPRRQRPRPGRAPSRPIRPRPPRPSRPRRRRPRRSPTSWPSRPARAMPPRYR